MVVLDMVDKGHDVRLYCRNESISKFDAALEKVVLILIMREKRNL